MFYLLFRSMTGVGQSETVVFNFFNEDQGLPYNSVFSVFQDSASDLWFGSDNGLHRYNGFTFQSFRFEVNRNTGLGSNNIRAIEQDKEGRIWVGTDEAGLSYSDQFRRRFNQFESTSKIDGKDLSSSIYDITPGSNNELFIVGNKGLQLVKYVNGRHVHRSISAVVDVDPSQIDSLNPKLSYLDEQHRLWLATKKGICFIDLKNKKFHSPEEQVNIPKNEIDDITLDRNGNIWLSIKHHEFRFWKFDHQRNQFEPLEELKINSRRARLHFTVDADNRIWAAAFGDRVYAFDLETNRLFLDSKTNSNITGERFMRRPFVDRSGNVWIPSIGFFKFDYTNGFKNFTHQERFHQYNTAILKEDDALWLAYREAGIVRIQDETTELFNTEQKGFYQLPTNLWREIIRLKDGRIAAVGLSRMVIIDEKKKQVITTKLKGIARGVMQDSRGDIYAGVYDGLVKIDLNGVIQKTYILPPYLGESRNFVQGVVEDDDGNIFFGSQVMGLAKLNTSTQEVKQFLPDGADVSLKTTRITDICKGLNNSIWLATDIGIVHFDVANETATTYSQADGLINDYVCAILMGNKGQIFASTLAGISVFDPISKSFMNYDQTDGLLNKSYYERTKYLFNDQVYFGGKHGVDYFNSAEIPRASAVPTPRILGIKLNNTRSLPVDSIMKSQSLQLDYNDDLLEIEFGATRYVEQEDMKYEYAMDGLFDGFVELSDQRRIVFSDLPSGEYDLVIRSRPRNKNLKYQELHLHVEVATPFWETWWFRLGLAALILLATLFYVKYRERRIKAKERRESEIKQTILQLEKKAILAQMNPHFIFNSMNAIQQFMAENNYEDAMRYLSKFSRLLRQVLSISARDRIPVKEELILIEKYLELEKLRFENKFEYTIQVDEHVDVNTVMVPPFLIQPQIERAVQQVLAEENNQGLIKLKMSNVNDLLRVLVEDNSLELNERDKLHLDEQLSEGISIVKERLRHINQDLSMQEVRAESLVDSEGRRRGHRVELLINTKPN